MGKKGRRTRWRTLSITDEHSDSEESNTTASGHRVPKGYPQKSYYSRFTYSSQSTPTRRYQDGTKSTRSSSTASENKITFNEDEYTRITTPRQDVLFKKGYLNKPKTYQTQTSTGNSTTSTGNSTGNGTPDHQSTDLEYESQFVFPNGFVDQNGIYYVNSFEPYPVMIYNPPTYYPEYATSVKSKRCSTGSLTESTSPNNEENSQDLSQSETPNNVSDLNHMYNVIYPGYYYDGACQPQDAACEPESRRVKKRRRRKLSRSKQEGTTSESSDEIFSDEEETKDETSTKPPEEEEKEEREKESEDVEKAKEDDQKEQPLTKTEKVDEEKEQPLSEVEKVDEEKDNAQKEEEEKDNEESPKAASKYDLKPDAEEFVPRAYRHPETIPMEANVQFIKIPNFVPVPILNPLGEFNAFIPPGIPINFIPQNYVNFVPYKPNVHQSDEEQKEEKKDGIVKETVDVPKNQIDISRIVSKLEEAAKEQDDDTKTEETTTTAKQKVTKKRHKFQKVDLRRPEEKKTWNKVTTMSPKKEEAKPIRNYSETLKKSIGPTCERYERNMERKNKVVVKEMKAVTEKPPVKAANEWIAVSRKKRRNKNAEESEGIEDVVQVALTEEVEKVAAPPPLPEPIATVDEEPVSEVKEEPVPEVTEEPTPEIKEPASEVKEEKKTKKKTKKNQKVAPTIKRVIITDIDLSVHKEEPKTVADVVNEPTTPPPIPAPAVEEVVEKKSKKKKKKPVPKHLSSPSSSHSTLNLPDDSYDFLLDESLDKTNVEVSQELDKMIQRGMYNSLEEKIKSMNIESNDTFFKTIISNISSRESSVEKSSPYIKTAPLNRNFNSPLVIERKPGDFLSEDTTPEPVEGGDDNLYPITRAVKAWMTKTREATPDVELLKSPSTIFKEFGDDEIDSSSIEEAEEVLETSPKTEYPKHGNLPYRAICCSIM